MSRARILSPPLICFSNGSFRRRPSPDSIAVTSRAPHNSASSHYRFIAKLFFARQVDRRAKQFARHWYQVAAETPDDRTRAPIVKLAHRLESVRARNALLESAKTTQVVHHRELDTGHFLLNRANGTVDLQHGTLRPPARADLLTHGTGIAFDPAATASVWDAFLHAVFAEDADLIQFLQRAVGYSLTSDVREHVLFLCHGSGSNGKSVLLNTLQRLLGTLSLQAAPDLLMARRTDQHPTERADLYGRRLVVSQETTEGGRLNETLVKALTGGDPIRARRMREDFWEFCLTHPLWLSTHHKPVIRGTDYAIWWRIRLIPFAVPFRDDTTPRQDPPMEARLAAELPGVLAWAVRGGLNWQRHGLQPPKAVTEATAAYRAQMDVLAGFLADCCVLDRNARIKAADLYQAYGQWCEQNGERVESQRSFGMRLTERGFEKRRSDRAGAVVWHGIGLQQATEPFFSTEGFKNT